MRSAGVVFWLLPSWAMTLTVPLSRSAVCLSTFFFIDLRQAVACVQIPCCTWAHFDSSSSSSDFPWLHNEKQHQLLFIDTSSLSLSSRWLCCFFGSAASSFRSTDAGVCRRGPAVCVGEHGVNWHWGQVGYFKTVLFIQKKTHWSTLFYNSWLSSVMHHVTEYIALYHGCVFLH